MANSTSSTTGEQQAHEISSAIIKPDNDPYSTEDPAFLLESDTASSTQSLSSSVLSYQYENGRRYHAYREGEYLIPNDDQEQERMDLHHHVCRLTLGGALFRAPTSLEGSARVLDLGTGTGIWAIDVADEYPSADIIGIDLSPIQPVWVPPNCFFEINDFESSWDFSKPFDFIHARMLSGSVRDFPRLWERSMENLRNGGWIEFGDAAFEFFSDDNSLENAPNLIKLAKLLDEASRLFGKRLNIAQIYKPWMIEAGFKNLCEEVFKVPINPWPKDHKLKELGRYHQVNMIESIEAYTLAPFTRVLGWSKEEVLVFLADVHKELADRTLHIYIKFYFVYGQKAEEGQFSDR